MPDSTFRELADNAPVMIWRATPDKLCDWFNQPWLAFVGRSMEQELGYGWAEGVHPDDLDRCVKIYTTSFDARESFSMTYRLRRRDGVYRWILDNGAPFDRNQQFAGYFGTCVDVTDQREAHDRAVEALSQRDAMLREVYHRVKNNLQQIEGLIAIESMALTDPASVGALAALSGRVRAMGAVHSKLLQSRNLTRVCARDFITDLCIDIARGHGAAARDVELSVNAENRDIDIEQAIVLGLLVNELATNAFKHAFPEGRGGRVMVVYGTADGEGAFLEVSDNGVGLADGAMSSADRQHSGFRLIQGFVDQLNGRISIAGANGTVVRVVLQ